MPDLSAATAHGVAAAPRLVDGLRELAGGIDVLLCDVWGVVHNGQSAHPAACAALETYRAGGGLVVMVSNSPRPSPDVIPQLLGYGVTRSSFDRIITSGDLTRQMITARAGQPLLHLGPGRDHTLFAGLDAPRAGVEDAEYCVCTGFADDESETPDDYAAILAAMAARGLTMICANPDLIVERGHRLIPCAGAMAQVYEKLGGETIYAGKPHRPVYEQALAIAGELRGGPVDLARVLGIGDAIRTDVAGAHGIGVRSILLLDGIHWGDVGRQDWRDHHGDWLRAQPFQPTYVMPRLSW
ncbi:MAG: TIGR01459 family HAD-type hydrolase [Bosea sp.]|jgi:HAD superfamily hydrolase (TIGR01459 family)|nr:TIGR01459 family HAD-type hydrolase [Bosea sp. (in: a-proteobacteria)]